MAAPTDTAIPELKLPFDQYSNVAQTAIINQIIAAINSIKPKE